MEIVNKDGLLFVREKKKESLLGFLFDFKDHGVHDASKGRVPVSIDDARKHNDLLSKGEIMGLDQGCRVGQRGTFYLTEKEGRKLVTTWIGDVVTDHIVLHGSSITFYRNGKSFRGRLSKQGQAFNFRRIA